MPTHTERRTLSADLEVREAGTTITLEGYASTFNQPYEMGLYRETIAPGAFRKTLTEAPDVRFLINHEGLPLARTTSGTLELAEDSTGLHFRAELDPSDPDVARISPKIKRGDLSQCSFGFRTIKDEWTSDYSERTMRELSLRDGDVSVVTYPANPSTSAKLRASARAMAAAPLLAMIVGDLRAGKTLSQEDFDALQKILDAIAAADVELDQALVDLSSLMGIENPDEDVMPAEPIADAMDIEPMAEPMDVEPMAEPVEESEEEAGIDIDVVISIARAKAQALATAAQRSAKYLR